MPVPVTPVAPLVPAAPRPQPVLGWLGRLVPIKDGPLWLEVLARVRRTHDVAGLIAGDGPERADLERRAAGLPVRFAGIIPAARWQTAVKE